MQFDRPELFGFLALAGLVVLVGLFARRVVRTRATYAFIWERLAARRRRPRVKRLLRRLLSALLWATMLCGVVVSAAEPRPKVDPPMAADLLLVLDTSPATVRLGPDPQGVQRLTLRLIAERAMEHARSLPPESRVWATLLHDGAPVVVGPYTTEQLDQLAFRLSRLYPSFRPASLASLADSAAEVSSAINDLHEADQRLGRNATIRRPIARLISGGMEQFAAIADAPSWPSATFSKQQTGFELVGTTGRDAAFTGVEMSGGGTARVIARGGREIRAFYPDRRDAGELLTADESGGILVPLILPHGHRSISLSLDADNDPISDNNRLELSGRAAATRSVGMVFGDDFDRDILRVRLRMLVPEGQAFHERQRNNAVDDTVVIAHGTADYGVGTGVRALVCFGQMPPGIGPATDRRQGKTVNGILRAPAWMTGSEIATAIDGLELEYVYPLPSDSEGWEPLLEDPELGVLVAARRYPDLDVLYIGGDSYSGDFTRSPELALMIRRWMARVLVPDQPALERLPLVRTGDVVELGPGHWRVVLTSTYSPEESIYLVQPGSNGIAGFDQTWTPGLLRAEPVNSDGSPDASRTAFSERIQWLADSETMPFGATPMRQVELAGAGFAEVDVIPPESPWFPSARLLLLIAVALMLLEWLLYWIGILE